jgi:hypothetical protein
VVRAFLLGYKAETTRRFPSVSYDAPARAARARRKGREVKQVIQSVLSFLFSPFEFGLIRRRTSVVHPGLSMF